MSVRHAVGSLAVSSSMHSPRFFLPNRSTIWMLSSFISKRPRSVHRFKTVRMRVEPPWIPRVQRSMTTFLSTAPPCAIARKSEISSGYSPSVVELMIVIVELLRQIVQDWRGLCQCPSNGGLDDLDRAFVFGTVQHVEIGARVAPYEFDQL